MTFLFRSMSVRLVPFTLVLFSLADGLAQENPGVIDSLNQRLERALTLEEQSYILANLSEEYEYENIDTVLYLAQSALKLAQQAASDSSIARAYLHIASYYGHLQRFNFDSLDYYLAQSLALYAAAEDSLGMANAYRYISFTCHQSDNYPLAIQYGRQALDIYEQLDRPELQAVMLSQLCEIQNYAGNNELAMKHCVAAQRIFDAIQKEREKAILFKTMGSVNYDLGNYSKAREYLLLSVDLSQQYNDSYTLSSAYIGLGQVMREQQGYEEALDYFQRALAIDEVQGEQHGMGYAYYNIGKTYVLQGENNEAIDLLEDALAIAEDYGDLSIQTRALLELGKAYYNIDDLDQAFLYLNQSLQFARGIKGSNTILQECYFNLAKYYGKVNELENALVNFRLYSLEQNRFNQEQSAKRVAEMQALYELEEKDRDIELLQQENQIQVLQANERKLVNYVLTLGLVFLFGLGLLFFSKYRLKAHANRKLELQKEAINDQKQKIEVQRDEIIVKSKLLEENTRDIKDSIEYAKRIQLSLLPDRNALKHLFPESFTFFQPKDIVSGDFYWLYETPDTVVVSVLDCTGHGVPGAFMTVLANATLNQLVIENKVTAPHVVLSHMDTQIREALRQRDDVEDTNTDGLDMAICFIRRDTLEVCYSGAQMPIYYTHDDELCTLHPDRYFIGGAQYSEKYFTNQCVQLQRGDTLYLATDGFQDQFGGPRDKKFMRNRFRHLLQDLQEKPIAQQAQHLEETFCRWKGEQVQTDDVLVMGIRL